MTYFLRRVIFAITHRKQWLLLALFPPLVFIVMSATTSDRFSVSQDVTLRGRELTGSYVFPFVSAGVLTEEVGGRYTILPADNQRWVYFSIVKPSTVRIVYEGRDAGNGADLVAHYGARLRRALVASPDAGVTEASFMVSSPLVEGQRALWRPERSVPVARYIVLSFVLVGLVLIGVELADPSLKSERKAARYLNVPMLGSLPSMEKTLRHMEKRAAHEERGHRFKVTAADVGT